jgi:hypothetical protein
MLSFQQYITERETNIMVGDLDLEFLRKAERVTSFNISTKDFESLKHKKEIQHLINKHFFPKFDISKTINGVNKNTLNKLIDELKAEDSTMFSKLHSYALKGVGPGEAALFFLINDAQLGGGSSAGVDLVVGSNKYEIKAVQTTQDIGGLIAYDFKLGGTVRLTDIMQDLAKLADFYKVSGSKTEINKSSIQKLKNGDVSSIDFSAIEDRYRKRAYEYFKNHEVIFINNSKTKKQGRIEAIKKIKPQDIMIERVTSGTIKPMVYID